MGEVRAGHTLGRYELLVPIALGGMASVWAARMGGPFPRIVAVKLLRAELSDDPDFEAMFLDEATLVSQIRHPNVTETLDAGEEDGVLYQVMELIDGEPLNLVLRECKARGGMPLPVALRIMAEVCLGLHAAHELHGRDGKLVGLVHRDVSPQNILVSYEGAVKLVDFGVAKAASNLQRTKVGQVKGKYAYMSPEQASSEPVDRRSDIFTLGIVFYQLVTGKHPFLADNELATMRRICDKDPVAPPRSIAPALPEAVERLLMKALAKPKEERFATMADMHLAIEQLAPAQRLATGEELAALMQRLLGPRGERRRAAIREAMQLVRERNGALEAPVLPGVLGGEARPEAGARAGLPRPPPSSSRSAVPVPLRQRRRRFAPIAGIVLALCLGVSVAYLIGALARGSSSRGEGAAPLVTPARSIAPSVLRAARAAALPGAREPSRARPAP